jgi:hypothetical protein
MMSTVEFPLIYDDLVNLLVKSIPSDELLNFQLSSDKQQRLDDLLAKNRDRSLTAGESAELDSFEQFEHLVRLLKARARRKQP